eukprot:m.280754 g.280754  ORF g.280754 m.280754 type:complete len:474 (+) comp19828_c0_seq3:363-1784(+)
MTKLLIGRKRLSEFSSRTIVCPFFTAPEDFRSLLSFVGITKNVFTAETTLGLSVHSQIHLEKCYLTSTTGSGSWNHGWDTAGDAWWGYGGMVGSLLSDAQAQFVAKTYKIVTLSFCPGGLNATTRGGVYQTAKQLKAINPDVKILMYWSACQGGLACYAKTDEVYQTFMSHSDWWLHDDYGNAVQPLRIDVTNDAAVAWWVSIPLGGPDGPQLLDGILADCAGYDVIPNISSTRLQSLLTGKLAMLGRMQQVFTAANGGLVLGNGLAGGPINPEDPHNMRILNHTNGVENEHFAVFEQVNATSGALLKDKVTAGLAAIEAAATVDNSSKIVCGNFWPGPYIGFKNGWPIFAPEDPHNKAPTGTSAEIYQGWQAQLEKYLTFNLAAFLTVAGSNTYFTYFVWYPTWEGFVECSAAPSTCAAPPQWYPLMAKQLGPPTGARVQTAAYRWQRTFAHAVVTLDLDDPLGAGTSIVWK